MPKLIDMLNRLHKDMDTSSPEEIKRACELIIRVQAMTFPEQETLECAFKHGPIFDGGVPSKSARTQLVTEGFMSKVVVKGEDGFNACTYKGASAYRIIEVMRKAEEARRKNILNALLAERTETKP